MPTAPEPDTAGLSFDDLIPDRSLTGTDPDAFNHEAIAARIADLTRHTEPPASIALFGPWGSGKSSLYELLCRALEGVQPEIRPVRYDAWQFGGESLQRNFISHVAADLGFSVERAPQYHRGLYEKRRTASLDLAGLTSNMWPVGLLFLGTYLFFLVIFSMLAGVSSLLTDRTFLEQVSASVPALIAPTGLVALIVAASKALLDGAQVEVEQAQPAAEEEFAKTFRELVGDARSKKGVNRLLVFVDELDRCAPDDVVATLSAIKTFLNQNDCVFVVAADRAVIERALNSLPQATPSDEENPYYSSASAFIDKVFQHQVPLPPLRGRRLSRFARDLVADRGGLWLELGEASSGRLRDGVIYALIPSHVRSPRRVKVLLNNFATNMRIAQAREIDYLTRATEIAKLTVLETEFPVLASDLHVEPRLPSLILDPPAERTGRVERLLARHGVPDPREGSDRGTSDAPDPVLVETDGGEKTRLIASEQRLLVRYLERTAAAGIPDPGRDLLFLEAAGAAVGLDDAELGELIESAAPEAPSRVLRRLRGESASVRQQTARVLADMADTEFGEERANVVTTLMEVAEGLGNQLGAAGPPAASSVRAFQREQQLREEHLVGGLSLALAASDDDLLEATFDDTRLLADNVRLRRVTSMLDRVPADRRGVVYERVGSALADDPAALLEPLRQLPASTGADLVSAEQLRGPLSERLSSDEFVDELYATTHDRDTAGPLIASIGWLLLGQGRAYDAVRAHADRTRDYVGRSQVGDSHALRALRVAPPEHWAYWADWLSDAGYSWPDQGARATTLLKRQFSTFHELAALAQANVSKIAPAVARFVPMAGADEQEALLESVQAALTATEWWADEGAMLRQEQLHSAIHGLVAAEWNTEPLRSALLADLQRAPLAVPYATVHSYEGVRKMGSRLGEAALRLVELPEDDAEEVSDQALETRAALLTAARSSGAAVDAEMIGTEALLSAASLRTRSSAQAIAMWLRLEPTVEAFLRLADVLEARVPTDVRRASEHWSDHLSTSERSAVSKQVIARPYNAASWIRAVAKYDLDEDAVVSDLFEHLRQAASADRRDELVSALVALDPGDARAQKKVADVILFLLSTGKRVDFDIALRAIPALGTDHRSAERLRGAFRRSADEFDHRVPRGPANALVRSGVRLPQKSLTKGARNLIKSFFGN